uniref:Calponin-homology (CH) domain-containing protein n=1 Tax=Eptatretus burgeri TaxID=7764 RepID=A0A8C4R6Q9_EPTBU
MEVPPAELCDSLLTWLRTFPVEKSWENAMELRDGVILAQVLQQIDPVWFDGTWMARIRGDTGDNWRLKASNLKKVYKGILDFYHEVLCQDLTEFPSPDLSGFAERGDRVAMARVLQLILGCAISCQHKHMYIQRIMLLEESVQHVVMATIQELITKEVPTATGDGYADLERQLKSALDELEEVMSTRDEFAQRCHTLDAQVAALQEERSSLLAENQQLLERLNQSESSELTSTPLDRRCSQLQLQVEQLQEEMYRLEATKEELRVKGERQERERVELSLRLEELAERAAETQSLRDELDVLRHTADKANRLEATVDGYRRRLEELGELRRQVRLLEEREAEREKQAQAAGDEVRKAVSARTTADTLRRELLEWQERGAELEVRLQQAEQKLKVEAEQRKTLEKEKERLLKERHLLKELADDLRCSLAQQRTLDPSSSAGSHEHSLDSEADDTLRQKLVRFVEENSMLKARQTDERDKWTEEEKLVDVPDFPELERSMRWRETLESENRELRERVRQLEREIGVMGERILLSESSEDLKEKLEKQLEDVQKTRAHFAEKQKEMELTCKL